MLLHSSLFVQAHNCNSRAAKDNTGNIAMVSFCISFAPAQFAPRTARTSQQGLKQMFQSACLLSDSHMNMVTASRFPGNMCLHR